MSRYMQTQNARRGGARRRPPGVAAATTAAVATAAFVAAVGVHAAPAAGICKSFSVPGTGKIQWSVIGNVSCQEGKPWLLKILGTHGAPDAQAKLTSAPKGFHCRATNNAKGIPSGGACYTGTLKFPNNGFQWFG